MSSFDEALRRAQADEQRNKTEQQSLADRKRRGAEQGAQELNQLLRDFLQRLRDAGVQPTKVLLREEWQPAKLLGLVPRRKKPVYSPEGYVLYKSTAKESHLVSRLSLLTLDGSLYQYSCNYASPRTPQGTGAIVQITADSLVRGEIWLTSPIELDDDGHPHVRVYRSHDDPAEAQPVEVSLATRAATLLSGRP